MGQISGKLIAIHLRVFPSGHFIKKWGRGIEVLPHEKLSIKFSIIYRSGAIELSNFILI